MPLTKELKKQYRDNVEIDCTMIHSSRPGNTFSQALEAGKAAYERLGYGAEFDLHHQGGPIGYAPRDYL